MSSAKAAAMRTLAVDATTCETVTALRTAGIDAVLLKGPTTAAWLYAGEQRNYVDTDLLVSPRDQAEAAQVLAKLGFTCLETGAASHERDDHSRTFVRGGCEVDLHYTLSGAHAPTDLVWSLLTRSLTSIRVGDLEIPALAPDARLVTVVLHAADSGGRAARTQEDLERAIRHSDEQTWRAAAALARELGALPAFTAGMRQARGGLEILAAIGVSDSSTPYELLRAENSTTGALRVAHLLSIPRAQWLRELGRVLLPSPAAMRSWSRLAGYGRVGLVLAYLARPLRLAVYAVPAYAAHRRVKRQRSTRRGS